MEQADVEIPAGDVTLSATVTVADDERGTVVFAHGSGSGRHSPRNQFVASVLNDDGFTTVLADLLTPEEERADVRTGEHRFDIALLARRVVHLTDWASGDVGLFGASTGAATALIAASQRPDGVNAVVSRGGRPDLVAEALERVRAPTLLIVGGNDPQVLTLNQQAYERLASERQLEVVPGATHLFEERGALERVAELAATWFGAHL
ncbi:MAG: alpha/beta fold hydrolase [Acidimicrobiia bacterium]|nr:alpha/beta fold hydrolase [Acidimicrobiia bacterium]